MKPTKMMKIIGVALTDERKELIKYLTKLGCIEFEASDAEELAPVNAGEERDAAELKLAKISFANEFIKNERINAKKLVSQKVFDYKREKLPLIARKPEIEYDEFAMLEQREQPIFDKITRLENLNGELIELKADEMRAKGVLAQIKDYKNFGLKLNKYADTRHAVVRLGSIAVKEIPQLMALSEAFESMETEYYEQDGNAAVCVVALKTEWSAINERLTELQFKEVNLSQYNEYASTLSDSENVNLKLIGERRQNITETVAGEYDNPDFLSELNLLEDYYTIEKQKFAALETMKETAKTFRFEGWLPDTVADIVSDKLEQSEFNLCFMLRDAREDEKQPTLLMDNAIVTPYHAVTNMFNVPNANEINPNPFVSFFFILFFGIMISDAGYGVLLTLLTGIVLAIAKPRRNEMSLVKVIFMGGISTIFWGIMFGGYFGMSPETTHIPAILFVPMNDPMNMLILSLGMGLLQMLTGMAINAYSLFKQHKPLDAIFGVFSWYFLIIGIAMFALGGKIAGVKYAGIALLAIGLVGLMVAGALHKRGAKKISGAFGGLYGIINFFSDLLSYSRLFGLGLATGVIAMVFNQMALVFIDLNVYVGSVLAVVLLIVGHLFNLAINTLGAYVHNSRLQFVEFFNKFYTGGGELFHPLGSDMKHYNFVQQQEEHK